MLTLRDYQKTAIEALWDYFRARKGDKVPPNPLLVLPTGCHERGYEVLRFDGKKIPVELVNVGDELMGVNGSKRIVTGLHRGNDVMYEIQPVKGEPFVVNAGHILSLYLTRSGHKYKSDQPEYINMSVSDYLNKSKHFKHRAKLYRSKIDFEYKDVSIDPWLLGFLLGDGSLKSITPSVTICDLDCELLELIADLTAVFDVEPNLLADKSHRKSKGYTLSGGSNNKGNVNKLAVEIKKLKVNVLSENKFIPDNYKFNSYEVRNDILSGLLDSDGHYDGSCFDYISKSRQLSEDVVFISRSLGLSAQVKECQKQCQNGFSGKYYRVCISGNLEILNIKSLRRKPKLRKQIKNPLVTGFSVKNKGVGEYFGFSLDGDKLYLGHDFIVHHNSGKSVILAGIVKDMLERFGGRRVLVLTHQKELIAQNHEKLAMMYPESDPGIYSASIGKKQTNNKVLFCGIQSVYNKASQLGDFSLILIDECHLLPKSGNGMYRRFIDDMRKFCGKVPVVGLTATPYRLDSGYLHKGDGALFTGIAHEVGIQELLDGGYLSPLTTKKTGIVVDASKVKKRGGEFVIDELEKTVEAITEAAIDDALPRIAGRKSGLVFCVTVRHAEHVSRYLNDKGISCAVVSGETPQGEREALLRQFKAGEIKALANVNVLCLDSDTEILTKEGWVGIDEMTYQHNLACWDYSGQITFSKPKFIIRRERMPGERMVVANGNAIDFRITEHHRVVRSIGALRAKWAEQKACDVVGKRFYFPSSGYSEPDLLSVSAPDVEKKRLAARIRSNSYNYRRRGMAEQDARRMAEDTVIRLSSIHYTQPNELSLDDCRFIGFWLADGSLSNGRCVISQSERYMNIIEWFDGVINRSGLHHSRHKVSRRGNLQYDVVRWSFARGTGGRGQSVDGGYLRLEPYLDKNGSYLLWGFSQGQLSALLEGFWYGDGLHGVRTYDEDNRNWVVVGTQKHLYDLIQAVGTCRGFRMTLRAQNHRNDRHSKQWALRWQNKQRTIIGNARPNFEPGWREERVWCVTSETSFIITRRNGIVMITGNTTGFDAPNTDFLIMLRPTMSAGLFTQISGRGMRVADGKTDCLVLDYAGNIARHGPIDKINIREKRTSGEGGEAPIKTCPECEAIVHASVRLCQCGYKFPPPAPKIENKASTAAILSKDYEPEWRAVDRVTYSRWPGKDGKPGTMRVDYWDDSQLFPVRVASEFVCVFHPVGWAREKAVKWCAMRGVTLENITQAVVPLRIQLDTRGKYATIVGYDFSPRTAHEAA